MLEAIIFDWAGTLADHGSRAPLQAFINLFKQYYIDISIEEAREPMGKEKREHIIQLLNMPRIKSEWLARYECVADDNVIDQMYKNLIPLQKEQIDKHCQLIPGALETISILKDKRIKIGTTTGYGRAMIGGLLENATQQGFTADSVVASDDVGLPRPAATGALKNLVDLNVSAVHYAIKVDDTEPGIKEGENAGMWTVGVVLSGNALGMSYQDWCDLSPELREDKKISAYKKMEACGAHYLIDSIADLPQVISDIELRLSKGERP